MVEVRWSDIAACWSGRGPSTLRRCDVESHSERPTQLRGIAQPPSGPDRRDRQMREERRCEIPPAALKPHLADVPRDRDLALSEQLLQVAERYRCRCCYG